jgi:hypothetical protein
VVFVVVEISWGGGKSLLGWRKWWKKVGYGGDGGGHVREERGKKEKMIFVIFL